MSAPKIVVGGGVNGLVAAWRLADAGHPVVVCERRGCLGGLAALDEFHPGFHAPGALEETGWWRPWISECLDLDAVGWRSRRPSAVAIAGPGGIVGRWNAAGERSGVAEVEGSRLDEWQLFLDGVRPAIERLLDREPPRLEVDSVVTALALARDGWALRRLGRAAMTELLRVAPMPAADWLRERFRSQPLMEALIAPAVMGTWLGPHSAGSAANLLAQQCRAGRETVGGAGALVDALEAACRRKGVAFEFDAKVVSVITEGNAVKGVVLDDERRMEADAVVATCDPKRAFAFLPPASLPLTTRDQIRNWRTRGTLAKVHLALSDRFEIDGRAHPIVRLGTGTIDGLERAFDAVKYGRMSQVPLLEVRQPSLEQEELAPPGGHVLSIAVAYAPYDLRGGWDREARQALLGTVVARLTEVCPRLPSIVVASQVLSPADLERRYGATGGHQHHGEHALDQMLFVRPSHRLAHYATPIDGFFLAGSGSHPGGGLSGVPGWLGAGATLR